jgi:hypothetical protein
VAIKTKSPASRRAFSFETVQKSSVMSAQVGIHLTDSAHVEDGFPLARE